MCPILAGVLWIVTISFDNEYTCVADVACALVIVRDAEARCKHRLKASTACKTRTWSLRSTYTTSSHAVVLKLPVKSHSSLCTSNSYNRHNSSASVLNIQTINEHALTWIMINTSRYVGKYRLFVM